MSDILANAEVWEHLPTAPGAGLDAALYTDHGGAQLVRTYSSTRWVWPPIATGIWPWVGASFLQYYFILGLIVCSSIPLANTSPLG